MATIVAIIVLPQAVTSIAFLHLKLLIDLYGADVSIVASLEMWRSVMGQASDYGRSKIDWTSVNLEHAKLAAQEYAQRLGDTQRDFAGLDTKARWALGVTLPLSVAVAGYIYAKFALLNHHELAGILCLATMLSASALLCAFAIMSQKYDGEGMTPKGMRIDNWQNFITGGPPQEKQFYGMKILQLSRAIYTNGSSNKKKSKRLKWGIRLAVFSVPASVFVSLVVVFFLDVFDLNLICPVG